MDNSLVREYEEKLRELTPRELGEEGRILYMHGFNSTGQPLSEGKREEVLEETTTEFLRERGFTWSGEPISEAEVRRLWLKSSKAEAL